LYCQGILDQNKNSKDVVACSPIRIRIGGTRKSCNQVVYYFFFVFTFVMSNFTFWSVFSLFLDVVMYLDDNTFVLLVFHCQVLLEKGEARI